MKLGDHLVDEQRGVLPYRVDSLIDAGEHYQIAGGYDEAGERAVAIRAILYDGDPDEHVITQRREALRREWTFLQDMAEQGLTPEPIDWVEASDSPVEVVPEPLLVCERVEGITLYDWICEVHPTGLEPEKALRLLAELVDFLIVAHGQEWLWRDFDPRRLIVDDEERLRAVSVARVVRQKDPLQVEQLEINADYVAPEIREEMTGKLQRPAADLYGVGALLSFLVTGEEPRHRVESPLSYRAYERVQDWALPGLELLIARLLQPLAKKRIGRAKTLRQYCAVEALPTRDVKGFGVCALPAPWLGLDIENPAENQGLQSSLSSGPLVSVTRSSEQEVAADAPRRTLNWPLLAVMIAGVVVAIGVAIWLA